MYVRRKNAGPSIKTDFRQIAFAPIISILGNVQRITSWCRRCRIAGWRGEKMPSDQYILHGFDVDIALPLKRVVQNQFP